MIFFICSVGFTFLFVIPLQSGTNSYLFRIIQNMWWVLTALGEGWKTQVGAMAMV